jgi:hypothetical protein
MSALVWVVLALAAVVVVLTLSWCVSRARRLDRLHVRLDAARAALVAAVDRRAAVALRIADGDPAVDGPDSAALGAAARAARAVSELSAREEAESALTRRLAKVGRDRLDTAVHEELVDAEQLVILARRVHNDAVRDTHALRSRRLVRWLRLAGTAPRPVYFDIAEPEPERVVPRPLPLPDVTQRSAGRPGA